MKKRSLLGFMVNLTVLGTSLLSRPQIAVAEPASIFKPILRNIQNQLPRGMVMRLPAFIQSRVKLYALVNSDSSGITVKLGSERNCNYHACSMGGLSVSRRDSNASQWLSDAKRNGTSITLKKGIIGFYSTTFSMSDGERRYVIWQQDGMIFSIDSRLMSRQEVIDAAISMANEPPIYDIATANSQIAMGRSPSPRQQNTTGRSPNTGQSSTRTASGQELVASNLGCTRNLRIIFGQQAPDYCTSSEADSGILLDNLKIERQKDRSIKLEMRVFNRGSADGLVEVYDSKGHLEDVKIIDGNIPPTSLIQSGRDLFTKVPASLFSRYPLGDSRSNLEEQKISVTIPSGGYVKITKSSNTARWYNTATLAVEISQMTQGDSESTKSETLRKFLLGFAKEFGTKGAINIFKGEPSIQAVFSLDFIDKNKLAEVLQKLVEYSRTIESNPFKNPLIGTYSDIILDRANNDIIENALDKYIFRGLGTLARRVRVGGDAVNIFARAADLSNATVVGEKATVILRDAASPRRDFSK